MLHFYLFAVFRLVLKSLLGLRVSSPLNPDITDPDITDLRLYWLISQPFYQPRLDILSQKARDSHGLHCERNLGFKKA